MKSDSRMANSMQITTTRSVMYTMIFQIKAGQCEKLAEKGETAKHSLIQTESSHHPFPSTARPGIELES